MLKKKALDAVGGFDTSLIVDDIVGVDFAMRMHRAGYEMALLTGAGARHLPRKRAILEPLRTSRGWGPSGLRRLIAKWPDDAALWREFFSVYRENP